MESKKVIKWCLEYQGFREKIDESVNSIDTEKTLSFLLVWSIWEQEFFGGSCRVFTLTSTAEQYEADYSKYGIENQVKAFHQRYQDKKKWKNLIHTEAAESYNEILKKEFASLTNTEKLSFALYVIRRYRNNIFHGNKASFDWAKYSKPITMCYEIMMNMLDTLRSMEDKKQLDDIPS